MFKFIKNKLVRNIKYIKENLLKIKIEKKYENLKPKDNLKIKSISALKYAFKNDKVRNIAITGNYSSGKSSYIESYIKKEVFFKDKVNRISLATFQTGNDDVKVEELEKYIIEQLYYSTYKKNLDDNKFKSYFLSIIFCLLFVCIFSIVKKDLIITYFLLEKNLQKIIAILAVIILILAIWIVKNILKYVYKIDKFSLQIMDLNIEIKNDGSGNIINENMDLIFKIFKKYKYKYIIFEDLDRFNKPVIFEHLRELNNILNKNLEVRFFYLIRDDIFKEENRTKFFDFIYPVIPYVSYTTSGEELNKLIEEYQLQRELPKEFIFDLTLFVQDMRILKNTLNEYRIYRFELNTEGIEYEKLFAILLYKNIFSEDFSNLQKLKGNLYSFFHKQEEKIKEIEKKIEEKNNQLNENDIDIHDKEIFCRAAERVIVQRNTSNKEDIKLKNIKLGDKHLTNSNSLSFEYLTDPDTIIPHGFYEESSSLQFFKNKSPILYKNINTIKLKDKDYREKIEQEIKELCSMLENIKSYKLKELVEKNIINDSEFDIFDKGLNQTENIRKTELVKYLLQEGYIDEDYDRYIVKFHTGSLTKNDNDFLGNCMINRKNNFLSPLENPNKIIERLKDEDFLKESVLNIYILRELMCDFLDEEKIKNFINTFFNSADFPKMIEDCNKILAGDEQLFLYMKLSTNKEWFFIVDSRIKNQKLKEEIIIKFLLSSDEKLVDLKDYEKLKEFMETNSILFNEVYKYERNGDLENNPEYEIIFKEIKDIINELDLKFDNLSFHPNNALTDYCVKNGNYKINKLNIKYILNKENITFLEKNDYSIIIKLDYVYNYIKSNINEYLENVYLKNNENENTEDAMMDLLNDSNITIENKKKIIERESKNIDVMRKIKDLNKIKDTQIYNELLINDLIMISYENINTFFDKIINLSDEEKEKISKEKIFYREKCLIDFINRNGILLKSIDCNLEDINELFSFICLNEKLNNDIYEILIVGMKRKIIDMDIGNLSTAKQEILIKNEIIEFNENMYERIRKVGGKIFTMYTYINRYEITEKIDTYQFSPSEILLIINSSKFHYTFKNKVLNELTKFEDYTLSFVEANNIINYIINKKIILDLSINQIKTLISYCNKDILKIKFINLNINKFNKDDIASVLEDDLLKYLPLLQNKKKPKYLNVNYNLEFIKNLKLLGYNIKYEIKNNYIEISPTNR